MQSIFALTAVTWHYKHSCSTTWQFDWLSWSLRAALLQPDWRGPCFGLLRWLLDEAGAWPARQVWTKKKTDWVEWLSLKQSQTKLYKLLITQESLQVMSLTWKWQDRKEGRTTAPWFLAMWSDSWTWPPSERRSGRWSTDKHSYQVVTDKDIEELGLGDILRI